MHTKEIILMISIIAQMMSGCTTRARLDEFYARGVLLMAGPLGNPPEGAMAVFTTREAAEEFIKGDPLQVIE